MEIKSFKWQGFFLVKIKDCISNKIIEKKIINNITDIAFNEIIKPLYDSLYLPNIEIKELAIGTGLTAPSGTDTKLVTEVYRISDSMAPISTGTGQVTTEFILKGTEYTGPIEEIGIFAGSSALPWSGGAGKDTGLLIARILWNHTMISTEEIYFQRVDLIS